MLIGDSFQEFFKVSFFKNFLESFLEKGVLFKGFNIFKIVICHIFIINFVNQALVEQGPML